MWANERMSNVRALPLPKDAAQTLANAAEIDLKSHCSRSLGHLSLFHAVIYMNDSRADMLHVLSANLAKLALFPQ